MRGGFSILLPTADLVGVSKKKLKLYQITAPPQEHFQPLLILILSEKTNEGTTIVNGTADKEVALESVQFGRTFPCIFQAIWEADPDKGPVRVSKLNVTDAYHRGTFWPFHVGAFVYVISLESNSNCIIICINMVLPMGCLE